MSAAETKQEIAVPVSIELGNSYREGTRYAHIKFGGVTVFSELVYDNEDSPAEKNIVRCFASRLERLLEPE